MTRGRKPTVLPKARTDFRLPPEEYALNLEDYGIDIPPAQLAAMAHQAFSDLQAEMKPIAEQIAKQTAPAFERLSRRDPRIEKAAAGGRRHSAVLSGTAEAD